MRTPRRRVAASSGFLQLFIDRRGDTRQLRLAGARRERIAELPVYPVKDIDRPLFRVAKAGVLVVRLLGRYIEREPLAAGIVVHELRHRAALAGQEAAAYQLVT